MAQVKPTWHFRERHPGEAIRGGINSYAFKINVNTLVRESLQNVNDQRIGDSVEAEYVLEDCEGSRLRELLELIGWSEGLEEHLSAIAKTPTHLTERARRALASVERGRVRILTIRDLGATGLGGPEDGNEGNFVQLCRHELVTDQEQRKARGGSFGLGKTVLWAFSDASTVLFSSMPNLVGRGESARETPRFFGRSYLVSHELAGGDWHQPDGHLGAMRTERDGARWAVSLRDADARSVVDGTPLDRDWKVPGTSILVPFLDDPSRDDEASIEEMLVEVQRAVQLWFWPSLVDGVLSVRVGHRARGREELELVEIPRWVELYRRALTDGVGVDRVLEDGGSAQAAITVDVKRRTASPTRDRATADTLLAVTKLTDDEADAADLPPQIVQRVALVRGARMVVEYFGRSLPTLLPNFVGVLQAGEYRGRSNADTALEYFLRDAEPPAHDRWDPQFEKLRNYEAGARKQLVGMLDAIGTNVRELLGIRSADSSQTPRELAEMLSGGGTGDRQVREEKYEIVDKELDRRDQSRIRSRLKIRRNRGTNAWASVIRVGILDEQGTLRPLEIDRASVRVTGAGAIAAPPEGSDDRAVRVLAEASVDVFEIECDGLVGASSSARRAMADVTARYEAIQ